MLRLCAAWCVGLMLLASIPARVRAQEEEPEEQEPVSVAPKQAPDLAPGARALTLTERLLLRQQWMTYREHERQSHGVVGPSVAVLLGAGAAATSAWLFTGDRNERLGGTLVAVFVAAPLLGVSISVLVDHVRKRRAIDREVWSTPPVSRVPFRWTF